MKIEIAKPAGNTCTGCPMLRTGWGYGCTYLGKGLVSDCDLVIIRDKDCPFDKEIDG